MAFWEIPLQPRFWHTFILCAVISSIAFIRSSLTKNYSFVDRVWSITPILYTWMLSDLTPRTIIASVLISCWGLRLTFNFYRRGGYEAGGEDYRWPYLRDKIITTPWQWHLFNLLFISFYQNFLLFGITLPVYLASLSTLPLFYGDLLLALAFVVTLAMETVADQQQYDFQSKKYELLESRSLDQLPPPYDLGFCTTGLFKYSRHPNFCAEISNWWIIAGFALISYDFSIYAVLGAFLLNLLFLGSTAFTEMITTSKYPKYKLYQQCTSMLIPLPPTPMPRE